MCHYMQWSHETIKRRVVHTCTRTRTAEESYGWKACIQLELQQLEVPNGSALKGERWWRRRRCHIIIVTHIDREPVTVTANGEGNRRQIQKRFCIQRSISELHISLESPPAQYPPSMRLNIDNAKCNVPSPIRIYSTRLAVGLASEERFGVS